MPIAPPMPPEAPRARVPLDYEPPTGTVIRVASGGDVGAALTASKPGDCVELEAGATWPLTYQLPVKPAGAPAQIRSSAFDRFRPGVQVSPADRASMPTLLARDSTPIVSTAVAAHGYDFVGVRFAVPDTLPLSNGLVMLGQTGNLMKTLADCPRDFRFLWCLWEGNDQFDILRGLGANAANVGVADSYFRNFSSGPNPGSTYSADAQALWMANSPGPLTCENTYFEASGENVLIGGSGSGAPELLPSDITFLRCTFWKPDEWNPANATIYDGIARVVKNLFELKVGRRVLVDGFLAHGSWLAGSLGQSGQAIKFTTSGQSGKPAWSITEDVMTRNGRVEACEEFLHIEGRAGDLGVSTCVDYTHRVEVHDVEVDISKKRLFYLSSPGTYTDPAGVAHHEGPSDVNLHHLTAHHPNPANGVSMTVTAPCERFAFTESVVDGVRYSFHSGGGVPAPGVATATGRFADGEIARNQIVAGKAVDWPAGQAFPKTWADVAPGSGADEAAIAAAMLPPVPPPPPPAATVEELTAALTAMTAERDALTVSLRTAEFEVSALEGMNVALNTDLAAMTAERDALAVRADGLTAALASASSVASSLASRLDATTAELTAMTGERDVVLAEVEALRAGITDATMALEALVA